MNTNHTLTELRVTLFNGTGRFPKFGYVTTADGRNYWQVGSLRSDFENKRFANSDEFKAVIKKYLTNPKTNIYSLEVDNQQVWFDKYDSIGQGFAKNVLELMLNKVN